MDAAPDDFMVVQQKYPDFSFFAHAASLTYWLFRCPGCAGYGAGCSDEGVGPLPGALTRASFRFSRFTWKSKQNRRSSGVSQECRAMGNVPVTAFAGTPVTPDPGRVAPTPCAGYG
ncbi:hypothetical protein GCM10017667_25530 [Streptomyces filamentosus]|uniref:Uncharacterized protein n=1 Tax=Streptomyces filamentosus TaxID=67294 RepID=A0A919BKY6_STRFL|nr:hypothetical protein GCM10017667_25530 [Streptomyces filamentosus]